MKFNKKALDYAGLYAALIFASLMVYGFVRDLTGIGYNYLLVGLTISWLVGGYFIFDNYAKSITKNTGESNADRY